MFANPVQEKADFNPLHREGGDRGQGTVDVIVVDFNPLHREGGDRGENGLETEKSNFNPLHREGGDRNGGTGPDACPGISIHSTARVETKTIPGNQALTQISIHSTARVETGISRVILASEMEFQSTPPRGWRRYETQKAEALRKISIHSTARVETQEPNATTMAAIISIHSTARVETIHRPEFDCTMEISIHSTARVETSPLIDKFMEFGDFNPLHREGGD